MISFRRLGADSAAIIDWEFPVFLAPEISKVLAKNISIRKLSEKELEISERFSPKELRFYSRPICWTVHALEKLGLPEKLQSLNRERVGVYVAGRELVYPWKAFGAKIVDKDSLAKAVRFNCSPRHTLIHSVGLAPAHLSIIYQIHGPTNAFVFSRNGGLHSLRKARMDLQLGLVDACVVVVSNLFEDPVHLLSDISYLETERGVDFSKDFSLCEGVWVALLGREDLALLSHLEKAADCSPIPNDHFFGYLDGIRERKELWEHSS